MSKNYKYTSKNLLDFKEHYHYSTFSGTKFLEDFIKSRELYLKKIQNKKNGNLNNWFDNFFKETINKESTSFLLSRFLKNGENRGFVIKLHKKFEVHKRVYVSYDLNDMKPKSLDIEILNFILLGLSLSKLYQESSFLGYLNSILKLNDIICSIPANENFLFSEVIENLIKSEIGFIRNLK